MNKQFPNRNDQMTAGVSSTAVMGIILVIVVLAVGGWLTLRETPSNSPLSEPSPKASDGKAGEESLGGVAGEVPEFSLQDYEGKTVELADFAGKPVVLNSWAVWCPFCVDELPDFVEVQAEFPDIPIVAIDRAESAAVAKGFTDEIGVTDQLTFLMDPKDSFYTSIGGFAMPETLFVNSDGTINFHKRGPMRVPEIRQRVSELK